MKSFLKFAFFLNFLILFVGCTGPKYGPTQNSNQRDLNAAIRAIQNQDLNDLRSIISKNNDILDGAQLFNKLRRPVMLNSDQTPEYSDIHKAGHEGGEFLFVKKK